MKKIRYAAEAAIVYILLLVMRALPLDLASATGGVIARAIGPRLAVSRKARRNLARALPHLSPAAQNAAILAMWDGLGRNFAEMPHIRQITDERIEIANMHIADTLRADGIGAIMMGGHVGNWELAVPAIHRTLKIPAGGIYRAPNNPHVARVTERLRTADPEIVLTPKGRSGTRDMVRAIKDGAHFVILIDQKYNEGIPAPFFGRPAMTSPAFAELGRKFNCPVVPFRIERLDGAHFRLTLFPPLELTDDPGENIARAHALLERWIAERPGQWLWLHRRWMDDKDKNND
jgi:KDO2-lipid IV(A) lauroyltransferase